MLIHLFYNLPAAFSCSSGCKGERKFKSIGSDRSTAFPNLDGDSDHYSTNHLSPIGNSVGNTNTHTKKKWKRSTQNNLTLFGNGHQTYGGRRLDLAPFSCVQERELIKLQCYPTLTLLIKEEGSLGKTLELPECPLAMFGAHTQMQSPQREALGGVSRP